MARVDLNKRLNGDSDEEDYRSSSRVKRVKHSNNSNQYDNSQQNSRLRNRLNSNDNDDGYWDNRKSMPTTNKTSKRSNIEEIEEELATSDAYTDNDVQLLQEESLRQLKDERSSRRKAKAIKFMTIALMVLCVYVVFLIYGVLNTEYVYDNNGIVVPQVMNVEQITKLENFNKLSVQYRQARAIYEQVLVLDYRIAAGQEDYLLIAPEYDKVLETVESLSVQVDALELPTEYTQIVSMLQYWVKTDIAVYCQNVSKAIAQESAENAAQAEEYKNYVYNDFSTITQNIATIGSVVEGADISDIVEWTPESYVQNEVGGILSGTTSEKGAN